MSYSREAQSQQSSDRPKPVSPLLFPQIQQQEPDSCIHKQTIVPWRFFLLTRTSTHSFKIAVFSPTITPVYTQHIDWHFLGTSVCCLCHFTPWFALIVVFHTSGLLLSIQLFSIPFSCTSAHAEESCSWTESSSYADGPFERVWFHCCFLLLLTALLQTSSFKLLT